MRLLLTLFVYFASSFGPASAQADVSPASLVGTWAASSKHPSGATVVATVVLQQCKKFTGTVTVDGKPFWEYSVSWALAGRTLTWRYEASSRPQPGPGYVDTDDVVLADASALVLHSKLSGKQHTYARAR